MSYRFESSETVEHGLRRIAREQIASAVAEISAMSLPVGERIHQARKRCKKLRGLFRLVRPAVGETYRSENIWFRDTARKVSALRDAETVIETFDALLADFRDTLDLESLAPVRDSLVSRRDELYRRDDAETRLVETRDRLERAAGRVESWALSDAGFDALDGGLRKTYGRARRGLEVVMGGSTDPEQTHEWRKRVKYHWYHLRLLTPIWEEALTPFAEEAHELSRVQGDEHDLAVFREVLIEEIAPALGSHRVETLIDLAGRKRATLLARAVPMGRRLLPEKPKALAGRLGVYWHMWRGPSRA